MGYPYLENSKSIAVGAWQWAVYMPHWTGWNSKGWSLPLSAIRRQNAAVRQSDISESHKLDFTR